MRKIINIFTGFLFSLGPLLTVIIVGIAIYDSLPNIIGVIIIGALGIIGIWIGIIIFRKVQIIGPIEFLTAIHASPDLDNLEPGIDSKTKRREANELVGLINNNKNLFKCGSIRIFGDWFGKPYDNQHEIQSAQFERQSNILTLNFKEGEKLEIHHPKHILEASSFLKVVDADRIRLSWAKQDNIEKGNKSSYLDYRKENNRIKTATNVDWYKPVFDVSLGEPALMIFGQIV